MSSVQQIPLAVVRPTARRRRRRLFDMVWAHLMPLPDLCTTKAWEAKRSREVRKRAFLNLVSHAATEKFSQRRCSRAVSEELNQARNRYGH